MNAKPQKRPVGRPRADGKPPVSREAVFFVATRLIAEHGFAGTSLRMIAQELGAQAPSITQLFKTKNNLLIELVQKLSRVSLDFHQLLAQEALPADVRLYKMLYEETRAISSADHDIASIYYLPELRKPEFSDAQEQRSKMLQFYQNTIQEGLEQQLFVADNIELLAEQMFQLTETGIIALQPSRLGTPDQQAQATADFVLRGLLARSSRLAAIRKKAGLCALRMVN